MLPWRAWRIGPILSKPLSLFGGTKPVNTSVAETKAIGHQISGSTSTSQPIRFIVQVKKRNITPKRHVNYMGTLKQNMNPRNPHLVIDPNE